MPSLPTWIERYRHRDRQHLTAMPRCRRARACSLAKHKTMLMFLCVLEQQARGRFPADPVFGGNLFVFRLNVLEVR